MMLQDELQHLASIPRLVFPSDLNAYTGFLQNFCPASSKQTSSDLKSAQGASYVEPRLWLLT